MLLLHTSYRLYTAQLTSALDQLHASSGCAGKNAGVEIPTTKTPSIVLVETESCKIKNKIQYKKYNKKKEVRC